MTNPWIGLVGLWVGTFAGAWSDWWTLSVPIGTLGVVGAWTVVGFAIGWWPWTHLWLGCAIPALFWISNYFWKAMALADILWMACFFMATGWSGVMLLMIVHSVTILGVKAWDWAHHRPASLGPHVIPWISMLWIGWTVGALAVSLGFHRLLL